MFHTISKHPLFPFPSQRKASSFGLTNLVCLLEHVGGGCGLCHGETAFLKRANAQGKDSYFLDNNDYNKSMSLLS